MASSGADEELVPKKKELFFNAKLFLYGANREIQRLFQVTLQSSWNFHFEIATVLSVNYSLL